MGTTVPEKEVDRIFCTTKDRSRGDGSVTPTRGLGPTQGPETAIVVMGVPWDGTWVAWEPKTEGVGPGSGNSIAPRVGTRVTTSTAEPVTAFFFTNFTRLAVTDTTPKVPGVVRKGGPSVCVPELRSASTRISPTRGY